MITGLVAADEGRITIDGEDVTKAADVSAGPPRGRIPAAGSIDLSRADGRAEYHGAVLELIEPSRKARKEQLDSASGGNFLSPRLRKSAAMALSGAASGGAAKVARALASRPSFMLLDEPFAGIDPIAVGDNQQLVRHLTERGIGVLITDHNVRETLSLIDRAYIIY